MHAELVALVRVLLFVVIFVCASAALKSFLWPLPSGDLPSWAMYIVVLCAATWTHRVLTVRFPGEKPVPTFQRQLEIFLMSWVPVAVLMLLMKLVDLRILKTPVI